MIHAEPVFPSVAAAELAGTANALEPWRWPKAPAACESPGHESAQAAGGAAGADAGTESSSCAEAARLGSMPGEFGAHAAAGSASNTPAAGSGGVAAGQPSSSNASTGGAEAGGSPPAATTTSNPVAERSKAHGAPADFDAIKYPYSVISTKLPYHIQRWLLPGKCPVLIA